MAAVFGQRLEDAVNIETRRAPLVVEQCVDFIRENGLQEEGLFRLPGQATLVRELQEAFDCGDKPLFDKNTDVHTVASLLKLYLRELPEPVIPFSRYENFLGCAHILARDQEEGTQELSRLVKCLPPANYILLKYICSFLDEVQSYSSTNKMSVQNLATVFAPNILRPKLPDPIALIEGASLIQHLMTVLIHENQRIFQPSDPSVYASEQQNDTAEWFQEVGSTKCHMDHSHESQEPPVKSQMWTSWKAPFMLPSNKPSSSSEPSNIPSSAAWLLNGFSSLRSHRKKFSGQKNSVTVQRLSTYDNVPSCPLSMPNSTWSSSCSVSLTESIASCSACRGSLVSQGSESKWQVSSSQSDRDTLPLADSAERLELCLSSSGHSDLLTSDSGEVWNSCQRIVNELKEELAKQRMEYENKIKSLESSRAELCMQVRSLQETVEKENKHCTLLEIKLRNSERGRKDAESRNIVLQTEMEEFFQTLGDFSQHWNSNHTK
ncbi:hypothetical protein GDO86_013031 [Hymenochirus boettgeri]|uniref:Rho-GAP domain-containing protein n=1 Tax=Hymenochirus boettgeri TaxID=247094 RepID=A0A8T2IPQ5_9PIPI|nr:hypothetical protein GDO86_013031 [Hymenochirus boettgeri]